MDCVDVGSPTTSSRTTSSSGSSTDQLQRDHSRQHHPPKRLRPQARARAARECSSATRRRRGVRQHARGQRLRHHRLPGRSRVRVRPTGEPYEIENLNVHDNTIAMAVGHNGLVQRAADRATTRGATIDSEQPLPAGSGRTVFRVDGCRVRSESDGRVRAETSPATSPASRAPGAASDRHPAGGILQTVTMSGVTRAQPVVARNAALAIAAVILALAIGDIRALPAAAATPPPVPAQPRLPGCSRSRRVPPNPAASPSKLAPTFSASWPPRLPVRPWS